MTYSVPEKFRVRTGRVGSDASFGNNGAFEVRLRHAQTVYVIASDGDGWEHVSVSRRVGGDEADGGTLYSENLY